MIYSEFKGLSLSRLGFGCMRFAPDPATGEIDQARVNAMFDLAIEKGVNYFDTAYPYLGGKSEIAMAEALKKYPRESYYRPLPARTGGQHRIVQSFPAEMQN